MTNFRKTIFINNKEYVAVSRADEYDFETIFFAPKEEWDAIVKKYGENYDLETHWYVHDIGVYEDGQITEYVDESLELLNNKRGSNNAKFICSNG